MKTELLRISVAAIQFSIFKFHYLIKNENLSTFFKAIPAPFATLWSGSSAMWN